MFKYNTLPAGLGHATGRDRDFLHNRDTGRIQELLSKQLVQVHKKQQELTVMEHQIKNRLNQIQGLFLPIQEKSFREKGTA